MTVNDTGDAWAIVAAIDSLPCLPSQINIKYTDTYTYTLMEFNTPLPDKPVRPVVYPD